MDHSITVAPGSEFPVQAAGDFVFCKFADRDIRVIIQNSPRTMRAGSKWRPAGGFEAGDVIVQNPDPVNPVAVVLTIGVGDFDDQIIHGEVTVNPGIRGRDGVFIDDTRSTVRLSAAFGRLGVLSVGVGEKIRELAGSVAAFPANARPIPLSRDRVLVSHTSQPWRLYEGGGYYETPAMNNGQGDAVGAVVGNEIWVIQRENVPTMHLAVRRFDAATLEFRGQFPTEITSGYQYARAMTVANGRIYIKTDDNAGPDRVFMTDLDGRLLSSVEADATAHSIVVADGRVHLVGTGGFNSTVVVLDADTLVGLGASAAVFPDINDSHSGTMQGVAVNTDGDLVVIDSSSAMGVYSPDGVIISASGTVSACAGSGRFKAGQVDTIAELYTQRLENGRVLASGQLLRAVLEIYAGRYMPNDYLDYIYAVKADNLNGISPRVIDAGGQSFAAAGIADDAAGTFPQTIEITLREGLL